MIRRLFSEPHFVTGQPQTSFLTREDVRACKVIRPRPFHSLCLVFGSALPTPLNFLKHVPRVKADAEYIQLFPTHRTDPYHCAASRTSIEDSSVGGGTRPLAEPRPSVLKRWKTAIKLRLAHGNSIGVSTYEDNSGEGRLVWKSRKLRYSQQPTQYHRKTRSGSKKNHKYTLESLQENGLVVGRGQKFSLASCLGKVMPLKIPFTPFSVGFDKKRLDRHPKQDRNDHPFSTCFRKERLRRHAEQDRNVRIEVKRTSSQSFVLVSMDRDYSRARLTVVPDNRILTSFSWKRSARSEQTTSSQEKNKKHTTKLDSSDELPASIQSDMEYHYKKNSITIMNRIGTARRMLQLNVMTNPFRLVPHVLCPVWRCANRGPVVSWTGNSEWNRSELALEWSGVQISIDRTHPCLSIRRETDDGGYSSIRLQENGMVSLNQKVKFRPFCEGLAVDVSCSMTNEKDRTGASLTAAAPWGSISAHARTSKVCGMTADTVLEGRHGTFRMQMMMENLNSVSMRLGMFY